MRRILGAHLLMLGMLWLFGTSQALADGSANSDDIGYIVGMQNSEDLVTIPRTRWLVASGLMSWHNEPNSRGHIYLVNREDKTFEVAFPGSKPVFRQDKKLFPDCPGPINPENFSAHGMSLTQGTTGQYRLYMTSHGEREAIEVYEIDARGDKPAFAWVGCVLLPEKMWGNTVAVLKDGGFLVTKSKDSTDPDAFRHLVEKRITGAVFEWHPGGHVTEVPGTAMSCPNGMVVSADDRWMFVNAMGTREVLRFDRKTPSAPPKKVTMTIYPDNIHWGDDGMLYSIGRNHVPQPNDASCPWLNCGTGWSIFRVDPKSLAAQRVAGVDEKGPLQAPSAAVTAGEYFWIGDFDGDRIGYLRRPK